MDRCIYELTFDHLKQIEIFIEIPIGYGFPTTYCISRWLMKSPNCILKRVSLRQIFYMPKGNDVKTLSMKFYWPTHH